MEHVVAEDLAAVAQTVVGLYGWRRGDRRTRLHGALVEVHQLREPLVQRRVARGEEVRLPEAVVREQNQETDHVLQHADHHGKLV